MKQVNEINLLFDICAVPKARARLGAFGKTYTPERTKTFEKTLKTLARIKLPRGFKPLDCAVLLDIVFRFERAKANKKEEHTQRPDLDNLIKSVKDALNKVVWDDDCQVVSINAHKCFGSKDQIEICIRHWVDVK